MAGLLKQTSESQCIMYNGDQLIRHRTLGSYGIRSNTRVRIDTRPQGHPLHLHVKTLMGKTIHINCDSNDTVLTLKEAIQDQEDVPPNNQRLIFGGKQLEDDRTLDSYNIHSYDTIQFVLRLSKQPQQPQQENDDDPFGLASPCQSACKPKPPRPEPTLPKPRPGCFKLELKNNLGKSAIIDAHQNDRVEWILDHVAPVMRTFSETQCIIYNGEELSRQKTLGSYGIRNNTKARIAIRQPYSQ
eukprot:UN01567